jgi:hypothetical protein
VSAMIKLLLSLFAAAVLCAAHVERAAALPFHSADGNFSVEFPEQPKFEKSNEVSDRGVAYELNFWQVDKGTVAYAVALVDKPQFTSESYDASIKGIVAGVKGRLVSQQPFEIQGMTGQEIIIECPGPLTYRERLIFVGSKFYQFVFVGPPGSEKNADAEVFLNSIHIDGVSLEKSSEQSTDIFLNGKLAGKHRDGFVAGSIESCTAKQLQNPGTKTSYSRSDIDAYCKCYSEKAADTISPDQFAYMVANQKVSADFQAAMDVVSNSCASDLKSSN